MKGNCLEVGYTERNSDGDIYGVLSHWDTSEISDMSFVFSGLRLTTSGAPFPCTPMLPMEVLEQFNPDLSLWNTSQVMTFLDTFGDQRAFLGTGLKFWSVSRAQDFAAMYNGCANFIEPISFWNVENAENMGGMFRRCTKFNADISLWKTPRKKKCLECSRNAKHSIQILISGMFRMSITWRRCLTGRLSSTNRLAIGTCRA